MTEKKGKIGVLIEEHFDPTEYARFNEYFPSRGYQVEYLSHLWGQPKLRFGSNPENDEIKYHVEVTTEVNDVSPTDYKGVIAIGAYATDRLRYQVKITPGQPNQAPAVAFVRKAMAENVHVGTICHGLWLLCADARMLKGRHVTCAHNLVCDVENAGAIVEVQNGETKDIVVDGNLVTGKHPAVNDLFMETFVREIERGRM
jgi:putative intracellular protease/amidase